MSRIGIRPIQVPDGVTVEVTNQLVRVKGVKGENSVLLPHSIAMEQQDNIITVIRKGESPTARALHGLARSLIANAVKGSHEGFTKVLEIQGVGFKAKLNGENLLLNIGFSHPVEFKKVQGVTFQIKGNKIEVTGHNKQQVGEVAAMVRRIHPPDHYKGKGIRYVGEVVRLKAGKAVKAAGGA